MAELLDTQTRGHHPHSPSSLQASEACPKFENEQRESKASLRGTLQHKAAETRDLTVLDGDVEMENAVRKCLQYEDDLIDAAHRRDGKPPEVFKEIYLPVGDDIVTDKHGHRWEGITGGYPDVIIAGTKEVDIPDWKFGEIPVTPTKDNLQGMAYALGVLIPNPQIEAVTVHFFGPYWGYTMAEHFSKYVHRFTRADIPAMELRIRTAIARKLDPDAKPRPANDLCLWCAHKGSCSALHQVILKTESKHESLVAPVITDHVSLTTPEEVRKVFLFVNQLDPIIKAIKKRAVDMVLTEGLDLGDDIKLVKRTERSITSQKMLVEIAKKHGVPEERLWEFIGIPITKVEEVIKELAGKGKGAAAVREFQAELAESGVVKMGTPVHFLQQAKSPAQKLKPVIEIVADRDDSKRIAE